MNNSKLSPWQNICHDQCSALFDAAYGGLDAFLDDVVVDLGQNTRRALSVSTKILDGAALAMWAIYKRRGIDSNLIFPSERRLARAYARHCLDPLGLETLVTRNFDLMADALARDIGHVEASVLVENVADLFVPARREALRRIVVGPESLRPLLSPAMLLAAPAFMGGASALLGSGTVQGAYTGKASAPWRRFSMNTALTFLGAGVFTTIAYRTVPLRQIYERHLESIEDILLFGRSPHDGPTHTGFGPGLLDLVATLEAHHPQSPPLASRSAEG